ncbi:MAG TPA: hypothetical protein DCR43_02505 [Bacteroidales bacterium]|nr:MAG: hypothetical protein A2X11_07385 [Bacteroidetes bacterium GWE2_42_24]OFY29517.1 MAG: hypothetical protein A2X09_04215 [Bacteroidetes bacterium GWF2_43_11]HAQ64720.1 hypothetical protein [Bacteroidales bacterium]HBZ67316.1 hypothetical protein [Bacteroidales bacterium]
MINQTDEHLLNGYIEGALNQDDMKKLNERIIENSDLKQKVMLADTLDTPLNDWQSLQLRRKLSEIHERDSSMATGKHFSSFAKWPRIPVAAALVITLIGLSLIFFRGHPQGKELYGKYYEPAEPFLMQRSAETAGTSDFVTAMHYYGKRDYVNSARLLASQTDNMAARFYLAISMMELNDFPKAIEHLKAVTADQSNLFTDQAGWYLALCYIKTDNLPMAKSTLKTISGSQSYFNDKAVDLLNQLD